MKMKICLSAYKTSGKDTLYKGFIDWTYTKLGWKVYSKDGTPFICPINPKRVALADKLKILVCIHLDLDPKMVEDGRFDKYKDIQTPTGYDMEHTDFKTQTLRQWCIDMASYLKIKYGDMYFVDLVKEITNTDDNWIMTDNRYTYEIPADWISVRLFRSDVPIPSIDDISERSMDSYSCDYLFVKTDKDYKAICKISPQYLTYTVMGSL